MQKEDPRSDELWKKDTLQRREHLNMECDRIPKFRMEMTGRRGVEIWIDGVNISQGVRSVTFSAEGCEKSPVLNLSLDVGDFSFLPERNLVSRAETKKHSTALDAIKDAVKEASMTS